MSDDNQRAQFETFFESATHQRPFWFQWQFARELPALINVPTGLGKTAMALVGWLWRRFERHEELKRSTPRRLIYCLPMRVLVEQTRDCAVQWLYNLNLLAGSVKFDEQEGEKRIRSYALLSGFRDPDKIAVYTLMGGEDEKDWDVYPERDAIIIGTQDMLLSRALNRGYAASRARWPMQFGLLHTDCLWVFDEIQLMGAGLATTAQIEAFRRLLGSKDGHGSRSVWMSATMQFDWLKTVDFKDRVEGLPRLELSTEDYNNDKVRQRWNAKKSLIKTTSRIGDLSTLADEVRSTHKPGTRTIIIVNTVRRACELFEVLNTPLRVVTLTGNKSNRRKGPPAPEPLAKAEGLPPKTVLLHSRFRLKDRKVHVEEALANPPAEGTIVISTQVIEAGVDVSATTLFTELAPWASLVQRFGRCNRKGRDDGAQVFWIDVPTTKADAEAEVLARPYKLDALKASAVELKKLANVGLQSLPTVKLLLEHTHVLRRKDLIDLFDTTPDLAGNDIDIDRFVREIEGSDVHVFWRDYSGTPNGSDGNEAEAAPRSEELCSAPIGSDMNPGFRGFIKEHKGNVWKWSFLDKKWEKADANTVTPGQIFLVHSDAGGYSKSLGWDQHSQDRVEPLCPQGERKGEALDAIEDERLSHTGVWQTVASHTENVCAELDEILKVLCMTEVEREALRHAARWHDRGKFHKVFQAALPGNIPDATEFWAKAAGQWKRYTRRYFRHELASALAVLLAEGGIVPPTNRNLIAYLVAAHHGKVRLSIRSLPNESRPDGSRRFARGIWDGDKLPAAELGGGVFAPAITLSLEVMELGLCEQEPFVGQPSWAERMICLRDTLGPFRLAYLEALLRAADMRASVAMGREEARRQSDAAQSLSLSNGTGKEAARV